MPPARQLLAYTAALALLAMPRPAPAHHSYAMFDLTKTLAASGTVAKFDWSNPHVFLWVYIPKPSQPAHSHGYDLFGFESGSPGTLERSGWSRDSISSGAKIRVQYSPLRDGRDGGSLISIIQPDGTLLVARPSKPAGSRP